MPKQKTIGLIFMDGFADWEYGLLAASAVEWFGARAVSLRWQAGERDQRFPADARPLGRR